MSRTLWWAVLASVVLHLLAHLWAHLVLASSSTQHLGVGRGVSPAALQARLIERGERQQDASPHRSAAAPGPPAGLQAPVTPSAAELPVDPMSPAASTLARLQPGIGQGQGSRTSPPTHVPPSFTQHLRVRRGAQEGTVTWRWELEAGRYVSRLAGELQGPGPPAHLEWHSSGGLDADGVSPERFVTRPARGGARAVNFERDQRRVSFSGPVGALPLVDGAQDRLSWLVQVMAILRGRGAPWSVGEAVTVWVAGPQGDGDDWIFEVNALGTDGSITLVRRAMRRFDLQVRVVFGAAPVFGLLALRMSHDGASQPPWEFWDAESHGGTLPTISP